MELRKNKEKEIGIGIGIRYKWPGLGVRPTLHLVKGDTLAG